MMKIMKEIDTKDMNTEEVRNLYVETMLPDCPEGNPLIEQVLSRLDGFEQRVTKLVVYGEEDEDGNLVESFDTRGLPRVIAIGDCPCGGKSCRGGWQWVMRSKDLNMTGHRGSLWAVACEEAPIVFDAVTGESLPAPPMGVNADEWSRYQTSSWGNVSRMDAQILAEFNLATAENRNNDWKVD
tara:strand:- start:3833 stop:4381 length:549 start_codon:yes stop_codon:yes gene_type:complete